jgi:PAS domain-containing protein
VNTDKPATVHPPAGPAAETCDPRQLTDIVTASRNKLKAVFDSISDPICSFTPDFRVESLNMALAEQAGRHPRELVGLTGQDRKSVV